MTEEFKKAIKEELMITLGTDIEKKFASKTCRNVLL